MLGSLHVHGISWADAQSKESVMMGAHQAACCRKGSLRENRGNLKAFFKGFLSFFKAFFKGKICRERQGKFLSKVFFKRNIRELYEASFGNNNKGEWATPLLPP